MAVDIFYILISIFNILISIWNAYNAGKALEYIKLNKYSVYFPTIQA